jgi:hypothetical protein
VPPKRTASRALATGVSDMPIVLNWFDGSKELATAD